MTPLATILLQLGVRVTGSDLVESHQLDALRALGARIWIGHDGTRIGDADVVVVSSAISDENPEARAAQVQGIPVIKHATALATLMHTRRGVAVAGTHGKSTTTAMIAHVLESAGARPTFHVGAELIDYGLFGRAGDGDLLIAEADEFDRRFLAYDPEIAVVTYAEADHLDYYGTLKAMVDAYRDFIARVRPGGYVVLNWDDPTARSLPTGDLERTTYGEGDGADWRLIEWQPRGFQGSNLVVREPAGLSQRFSLKVLGRHNALNATATIAVASHLGISMEAVRQGLATFQGIRRRIELLGASGGISVIDDYAHHPTEVRATLAAIQAHWKSGGSRGGQLWAVYQPHTEHRTATLFDEFLDCFADADQVLLTEAYMPSGRRLAEGGATHLDLVAALHHRAVRAVSPAQSIRVIASEAQPGDLVVVMGAGDIWTIEAPMLEALAKRFDPPAAPRSAAPQ